MKIYIEHENQFYDFSEYDPDGALLCITNGLKISPFKTDKRFFEIGAHVYFDGIGWTEVCMSEEGHMCGICALKDGPFTCKRAERTVNCTEIPSYYKKLDLDEKQEGPNERKGDFYDIMPKPEELKPSEQFYVINTKTGFTQFIHESHGSAIEEAGRLAMKQPGDIFRVLKVIGECIGKVNVEWK